MLDRYKSKNGFVAWAWLFAVMLLPIISGTVQSQDTEHPVVTSIKRNPPRTSADTARAILYLSRIERWKEMGPLLDQIPTLTADPANSLVMVRSAGLETWLKLVRNETPLSAKQKAAIQAMMDRAAAKVADSTTLKNAIQGLRSPELLERKRAVLAIQAAGQAGLSAMLNAVSESEGEPLPRITSEVIATFGSEGRDALKAAMSINEAAGFAKLLELASRIPGAEFIVELSAGLFIVDPKSNTHQVLEKALSPSGQSVPSLDSVSRTLASRMGSKIADYRLARMELTPLPKSYWIWQPSTKRVETTTGTLADSLLSEASELALLLLRIPDKRNITERALAIAILLESSYRQSQLWMVEDPAFYLIERTEKLTDSPSFLLNVLDEAKREGLRGAELRAVQLAGKLLDQGPQQDSGLKDSLIRLSNDGVPSVRYAAVVALDRTLKATEDPTIASGLRRTLEEMANLEVKPLALVIGGSADLVDTLTSQLEALEVRSKTARNAREAFKLIQEPLPIEMVFIVDRVADMSLSEFVQRLRAAPRTTSIPIVMMASQWTTVQQRLTDSENVQGILNATLTGNISFTAAVLRDIVQLADAPAIDSIDRITLRSLVSPVK